MVGAVERVREMQRLDDPRVDQLAQRRAGDALEDRAEHDVVRVAVVVDRAGRGDGRHRPHEIEHLVVAKDSGEVGQHEVGQLLVEVVAEVAHATAMPEQHRNGDLMAPRPVGQVAVDGLAR